MNIPGGIIGFDLARCYGWAYVNPDGIYVASAAYDFGKKLPRGARCSLLARRLSDLVTEYAPVIVAIEKPIIPPKTTHDTIWDLFGYAITIETTTWLYELTFEAYGRQTICKAILGNGRATKDDCVAFAQTLKPACTSHDEADAILVALYAHRQHLA